jgi:hypothetical protein
MANQSSLVVIAFLSSIIGATLVILGYEVSQFNQDRVESLPIGFLKSFLVALPLTIAWALLLAFVGWCLIYRRRRVQHAASISMITFGKWWVLSFGVVGAAFGYWIGAGNVVVASGWFLGIFVSIVVFVKLGLWLIEN